MKKYFSLSLDLTKQVNLLFIQQKQSSWNETIKTGCQLHSNTSPYKVSECFLTHGLLGGQQN